MSVGFMQALKQYGLRCPDDVAVVTCDDHAWLDAFSPRLTTIDLPKRELGEAAARALLERLAHPSARKRTIRLPSAMHVRESCGCAIGGRSRQSLVASRQSVVASRKSAVASRKSKVAGLKSRSRKSPRAR